ncbi:D-alanyl-D-alanine carboxypeptidase/D-alanyl-D-alanine-endopeptidase [Sulfitobacter sp. SK012]|uniref:D-alanyl-D-alanine carboxypeptidase/D-alanyl-D-alanine endopeptidase n=1 Tax=Sulfitobacter sp. SK012 TaxID=1389005 RepID=UPI000E0AEF98|nr:D-alanyl-D-alanine carboxypeptidase/D-alanyl-D-alanine-endopeptidase [Sulfitobacter sp. SK012]AXI48091.1 D-alanyl-D-alanine carboxypeptidase/D-alanyl-D-alanine-endopeptidase [Sulfitobacter sp. SK012]
MKGNISRRVFVGSTLAGVVLPRVAIAAPPETSLRPVPRDPKMRKRTARTVEEILGRARLQGKVSFAVVEAASGKALEAEDAALAKPPASVAKALTALYALDTLGEDHRFSTRLMFTGGIEDGEILGDLLLVGGGDPTLDTNGLASMAQTLKTAGVTAVRGGIKVYDGALPTLRDIDPGQPDHVGYNPGISGIALNFNRVHFEWKRGSNGYAVTMEGRSDGLRPAVHMASMAVKDRSTPIFTYSDSGTRDVWTVAKGALGKAGARWLPVRKPGLYAGEVFAVLAGAQGIKLGKPELIDTLPETTMLVRHLSKELRVILHDMLKYSTNLTAEIVGMAASQKRIGRIETLEASAAEMNAWAKMTLGMASPALVDHSGLGDASRVTAPDMVCALVAMQGSDFHEILKPVALRDSKGRPVRDHPVKVVAKTGTLNFVSALAGYITGEDGTELAFAIFAADEDIRATIKREDRERPPGSRSWNGRAKTLQLALIERWALLYAS